jgi:hypothetical protein
MGKRQQELRLVTRKRRRRNLGKDMWQSVPVLFVSVYYTVEGLCVKREKLFYKRHFFR